jgi:hypothetical protein
MPECRINQIIQLYNSQLRGYMEWRIVEDGLTRGYHLSDAEGDSDFMAGKTDSIESQ